MWLVASSERADLEALRVSSQELWRDLRRFNAPVQLAVAAAHDVVTRATAPAEAAIVSLAPCRSGSPDLHRWVRLIEAGNAARINPTHTLHAVDNLALSVLSIALRNHAWGMSLGGAAGMFWVALELAGERLEQEVIILGGDQENGELATSPAGVAMLFAREPAPYGSSNRRIRLAGVERRRASAPATPTPHAAMGARAMLSALHGRLPAEERAFGKGAPAGRHHAAGRFEYVVPAEHGDGVDDITVVWEIG